MYILLCACITDCFITGDTERVEWRDDDNSVLTISPTTKQCENIVSKLIKENNQEKNGVLSFVHHLLYNTMFYEMNWRSFLMYQLN